jgi:hypothetical protein
MGSDIKIKFGKYKGRFLKDVPEDYLRWAIENKALRGKTKLLAKKKINYPKRTYQVTVEDAVVGNGNYTVEAYNENQAIGVVKKKYGVQNSQSFHGTSYTVLEIKK